MADIQRRTVGIHTGTRLPPEGLGRGSQEGPECSFQEWAWAGKGVVCVEESG
jgi:hypothetical protein